MLALFRLSTILHRRNTPQYSLCSAFNPAAQRVCNCYAAKLPCSSEAHFSESSRRQHSCLLGKSQSDNPLSRRLGASATASESPTSSSSPSPSSSPNPYAVSQVAVGASFACLVMSVTSGVRCFGTGSSGQLAIGATYNLYSPPSFDVLTGVASISAGGNNYVCALLMTSGVVCWGGNTDGQLGTGNKVQLNSPPATSCITGVSLTGGSGTLSAGFATTCVVTNTTGVICWGNNNNGEVGNGYANSTAILSPPVVPVLYGAVSVSSGYTHVCALMNSTGIR